MDDIWVAATLAIWGRVIVPHTFPQMPPKYKKAKGKAEPKKSPENLQGKAKGKGVDDEEVEQPPSKQAKREPEEGQARATGQKTELDKMQQPMRYEPQKENTKEGPSMN